MAGAETTAGSTMLVKYRTFTRVALILMTQTTLAFAFTGCDDQRPGQPVPTNSGDHASVHEVADRLEGQSPGSAGLQPTQPSLPVHDDGGPSQADPGDPGEVPAPRSEPSMAMGGGGMHGGAGMGMGMGMHGKSGGMGMGGMMGGHKPDSPDMDMGKGGMMGDDEAGSPGMGMDMGGMADDDTMDTPDDPRSTSHGTSSAHEDPTETDELAGVLPRSAELLKSGGARFFLDAALMLKLSPAQQAALEEIAREHAVADERLRVRMAARESDLAQALDSADYDRDAVADIIEAAEKLRVRRRIAYLDALTEARDILTRRQRQRLTGGNERDEPEDEPSKSADAKRHGTGRHGG